MNIDQRYSFLKAAITIFSLALIIRILHTINQSFSDPLFYNPIMDSFYHHQWALSIIRGGWLNELPYFRAPLYPYLLASSYYLFGINLFISRIIQAILGASSCYLVFIIGKKLFSARTGFYAGIITALYPILIYFDGELLIPPLLIFLILLGFLFLIDDKLFLSGIFFGLAALTRPNILLFVAVLTIYYIIKKQRFAPILIGVIIPIIPVTIRNYAKSSEVIPIAWQGGINFYIGNNPKSDAMTAVIPETRQDWWGGYYDARKIVKQTIGHEPSYHEIDRYWFRKGLNFIKDNPLKTLKLYIKKIYLLIGGFEIANNRSIYFFKNFTFLKFMIIYTPFLQIPFGILFPLSIIGIYEWIQKKKNPIPIIFTCTYAASFLPFFINARYRTPLIPLLIIFAISGFIYLKRSLKKRNFLPVYIIIPIFLLINANLSGISKTNLAQDHLTLAGAYYQQNKLDLAMSEVKKSLRHGNLAGAYNLLGQLSIQSGKHEIALKQYHQAAKLDPKIPEPYLNIGNHYGRSGQYDSAFFYLNIALDRDPYNGRVLNSLGNLHFSVGNLGEAKKLYHRSSNLEPHYLTPLYHLALIHLRNDRVDSARIILNRMSNISPQHKFVPKLKTRLSN